MENFSIFKKRQSEENHPLSPGPRPARWLSTRRCWLLGDLSWVTPCGDRRLRVYAVQVLLVIRLRFRKVTARTVISSATTCPSGTGHLEEQQINNKTPGSREKVRLGEGQGILAAMDT